VIQHIAQLQLVIDTQNKQLEEVRQHSARKSQDIGRAEQSILCLEDHIEKLEDAYFDTKHATVELKKALKTMAGLL